MHSGQLFSKEAVTPTSLIIAILLVSFPFILRAQTIRLGEEQEPQTEEIIEEEAEEKGSEEFVPFEIKPTTKKKEEEKGKAPPPPVPEAAKPKEEVSPTPLEKGKIILESEEEKEKQAEGEKDGALEEVKEETPEEGKKSLEVEAPLVGKIELKPLKPPPYGDEKLYDLWFERMGHMKTGDHKTARKVIDDIVDTRQELGYLNLPGFSAHLVYESEKALREGKKKEAFLLADSGVELSPMLVLPYLARARARFAVSPSDFDAIFSDILGAIKAFKYDYEFASYVAGKFLVIFASALIIFALFTALIYLFRYGRMYMYDFSLIFPPSVPEYQTALLFLLIMSFPLILGVGLLFTLGLILTISAIYSKPAERFLMAVCIFLLIAFVPIVNAGLFFIDRDYNQYGLSWRALHSPLTKSEIAELEDYYETNRGNAFAAAALAAIKKRGGNYGEAEKILVETLSSNHGMVFARANLANIFLVTNRIDKAIVEYEEAIKSGSADTYLYFNLAQVFYRKFEPSRGQEYLERARREDMKLTKFLEESHRESANRFVFDTAPCVNLFFSELFDALDFFAPAGETAAIEMLGSLPYKLNALILLGFFGIILIVPNFSKKLKFAKACTKCGAPSSLRDNPEMPNQELCGQCFHLYVTRQVVSPQARLKKDVAIKRHFLREHIYLLLCSLLPGAGHIYSGKPIGGGFMLILVSIILVLLFGDSLVPNSVVPGLTGKVALIIPSVIILIVLYIISFVNYQKEKA